MNEEEEVERILADWQERDDGGLAPAVQDVLAAHPLLAGRLQARFELLDRLRQALSAPGPPPDATLRALPQGRYSEFRLVAEGGMGTVYWARDQDLNREVAFKVVKGAHTSQGRPTPEGLSPPPLDTPEGEIFTQLRRRFLQEAWITAGLTHAGIAPVHELGSTPEGVPYYTMRFVRGGRTLAKALEEMAGRGLADRLGLLEPFLRVCDTIAYAHGHGVLHRDLKPDNVALGEYGEVVVLDWGVAKVRGDPEAPADAWAQRLDTYRRRADLRTVAGAVGTPGYMAPEALRGDVRSLDERSDIYSLGTILYELLTGRRPLTCATWDQLVEETLACEPPRADLVDPGVPTALSDLCARCLSRDPVERPQRVTDVAEAVRSWQAESALAREAAELLRVGASALAASQHLHGPEKMQALDEASLPLLQALRKRPADPEARRLHALAVSLREQAVLERERHTRRRLLRWVAVVALMVGGLAALGVTGALRAERDAALLSQDRAEQAERYAQERLREMLLARARASRAGHAPGRRAEALDSLAKAAAVRVEAELAWEAAAALALADVTPLPSVRAGEAPVVALAASRDGGRIAWADARGVLRVRGLREDGRELTLALDGKPEVWTLKFDAAAERLLVKYRGEGRLRIYDVVRSALLWHHDATDEVDALDVHPGGDRFAALRGEGSVEVRRLPDGTLLHRRAATLQATRMRYSPDGGCLATVGPSASRADLLSLDDRWRDRSLALPAPGTCLAWSPEGRHLAIGCEDEVVYVVNLDPRASPTVQHALRGHRGRVSELLFTPGGDLLVTGSWDDTVRVWDPWTETERVTVRGFEGWLDCRADGALLSWVSPRGTGISRHALEPGRVCRRLPAPGGLLRGCALSPDGGLVVAAGEREVHAWDVRSGRRGAAMRGGGAWGLAFEADGALLTTGPEGLLRLRRGSQETGASSEAAEPLVDARASGDVLEHVAVSRDGRTVAVVDRTGGRVRLIDRAGPEGERSVAHPGVHSVALSPDGTRLATGTWQGQGVRLWDARRATLLAEAPTGDSFFARVAFDATGQWLIACDAHGVRAFSAGDLALVSARAAPPRFDSLCPHPEAAWVAAGDEMGRIHLLSLPTLATLDLLEAESGSSITSLAFDRTGSRLAASSTSAGSVVLWDLRLLGAERRRLGLPDGGPPEAGAR